MRTGRFVVGVVLLVLSIPLFFYIQEIKNVNMGFGSTLESITQMCNGGWGDAFNITGQCIKVQVVYYSPWLAGIIGIIFLAKAGPYRGYYGAGGVGSHYRRRRISWTQIGVIAAIVIGIISLYFNYFKH